MKGQVMDICRKPAIIILFGSLFTFVSCSDQTIHQGGAVDFDKVEAVRLFDGSTFSGWEGNLEVFRIEDAAIVGGTLDKDVAHNEFLCTTKEYGDFEFSLKVKLLGPAKGANAGIQFRSRRVPNHHEVSGYQADMGYNYWGCLYDEHRRGMLVRADKQLIANTLRPGRWNEYVIRCVGNRVQLWLNGHQTVDYTELDENIEPTGIIGLQIHGGPAAEAWYKDIKIKQIRR
jgi:hypothetical protein